MSESESRLWGREENDGNGTGSGEGVTCASYDYGQTEDRCKYFRTYLVLPPLSAER